GYGGGFYDRLLENLPSEIKKIALAFEIQVVLEIPVTKKDKKIDMIITEKNIYKLKG
ncbi:MAG: 5-formyltetrahydrofolate cyclo-ligase, partial [Actinobacteria bacterium]|nr:5-formyltetrahydrofolate cyclo-ligase [Actinomycetota bacterium]